MASDLLVEFKTLMKTRSQIDRRLMANGIAVESRRIEWPDTLAEQANLVRALGQANVRLGAALDQIEQEEAALDKALEEHPITRAVITFAEQQPQKAWVQ